MRFFSILLKYLVFLPDSVLSHGYVVRQEGFKLFKYEREIRDSIRELDVAVQSTCKIENDTSFQSIGMDSLNYVSLIVALEKLLNIEFPDEYLTLSAADSIEKLSEIIETVLKT